jgi:hypothetical protein
MDSYWDVNMPANLGIPIQPTACIISLGLDHCIAGDCNVHCESHLWLHPESARP